MGTGNQGDQVTPGKAEDSFTYLAATKHLLCETLSRQSADLSDTGFECLMEMGAEGIGSG